MFSSAQCRFSHVCQGNMAGSGEVPSRGRHNSSVPTRSEGRGVALAGSGEVPTRGRHDTRSEGRGRTVAGIGEVP